MQLTNKKNELLNKIGQLEIRLELILLVTGFGLELLAVILLFGSFFLASFWVHIASSHILAWSLFQLMPRQSRSKHAVFFLFVLCLFVPLVSGIGLLLALVTGLYSPKTAKQTFFVRVDSPQVSMDDHSKPSLSLSKSRIKGILRFCPEQEERMKAVMAIQRMSDETAIPLLNIALLDVADEVRLLAFSMLDNKRKKLDCVIHNGLTKLKPLSLDSENKKIIHQSLAEAFWELSYLGLVEGQSRHHALKSAKQYVIEALKFQVNDAGLQLLHARICISLNLYEEGENALKLSRKYGMTADKLAPLGAEIAFETKHFSEIANQLKLIDQVAQKNVILGGLVEQWN